MPINSSSSAPLWLELKTEYIDQNFDNVLNYLRKESQSTSGNDAFYEKTCSLLSERVNMLLDELENCSLYFDGYDMKFATRLVGAYLLVGHDIDEIKLQRCVVAFLLGLSTEERKQSEGLLKLAIDILSGRKSNSLVFSWSDITEFQPSVLTHKLLKKDLKQGNTISKVRYEGKGTVIIGEDGISLYSSPNSKSDVKALSMLDDRIHVMASKEDKIKQSEYDDIEKLHQLVSGFVTSQRSCSERIRKIYSDGSTALVKITGFNKNEISVESIDPKYEKFTGVVNDKFQKLGYSMSDLRKYLAVGSVVEITVISALHGTCTIHETMASYIVDDVAESDFGERVLACKLNDKTDRNGVVKTTWLTDTGYLAFTLGFSEIEKGGFAYIRINNHGKDDYYSFINATFLESSDENFVVEDVKKTFVEGFVKNKEVVDVHEGVLSMVCSMMFLYYQSLSKPSEKYMALCLSRILSEFMRNELNSAYILFLQDYLRNLVYFVKDQTDKMFVPVPDINIAQLEIVKRKLLILNILGAYDKKQSDRLLDEIIESEKDSSTVKIASLVLSCNRLGNIVNKSVKSAVKSEIIGALSLEMEGEVDLEKETGKYLGMENEHQEFKTSFFYAPSDAKEQNQKITIFKGLCAFLNSDAGGTLYLGVNDMGYVNGLETDLEYMGRVYYGRYSGMDGYVRCIIDEAKKYFDSGVLLCIKVTPEYDGKVVVVEVKPYPYGVVTIDEQAYVRLNNETVLMSDRTKQRLLEKRMLQDNGNAKIISAIQDAIRLKCSAIFHGYSSSNSGIKSERNVEPFFVYPGLEYVCCYDIDKSQVKVFKLDRIGNVEVTKTPWKYENMHKKKGMDIFNMSSDNLIHVILQLDMMAKNLLCEEYPNAVSYVKKNENGDDSWILETDVYSMEGVGRFYIGLANGITIVDAPGLAEYARDYASKYLLG